MDLSSLARLGLSWTEVGLTLLSALGIYTTMVVLTRLFGPRQLASLTTYDLAFVFALGSVIGRVVLVRTSLLTGVLGLCTLFVLHTIFGLLHHRIPVLHRVMQNDPILLVADGCVLEDNLRRAGVSQVELHQQLRLSGKGSLDGVRAIVLERNGDFSMLTDSESATHEVYGGVVGAEALIDRRG